MVFRMINKAPGLETSVRAADARGQHGRARIKASAIGWLAAVFWLTLCGQAGARIGDTLDQVLKRYGRCLKTLTAENGMVYQLFSKRDLKILVHFYGNRVDEISYGKDTDIFDEELKELMQANAPGEWAGTGWPVYNWHNGELRAHYSFEHRVLVIVTDAAFERERRYPKTMERGVF
jgi:hypothetical protein